jgi:GntR family transcriptional regulator
MDESARFVPRYYEIEQELRRRLASLRPGDPMPSDTELTEEFRVSRMTARNAMQRLVQEGIVQRVPGRGSFVSQQPVHRQAGSLISFSDEMRRQGRRPSSRLLRRGLRAGSVEEAAELEVPEVVELVRLRLADGEPIAIESSVFAAALGDVLLSADLEQGSLFDALVGAGHVPTAGRASLGAGGATEFDAEHLQLVEGAPLLVERRLILDQRGRALERTESRYAAERYSLDVTFDVDLG